MTDYEINMAIAKACGWEKQEYPGNMPMGARPDGWPESKVYWFYYQLPDYRNDLNAMHEAQAELHSDELRHYCMSLTDVCIGGTHMPTNYEEMWPMIRAIASQRAEAFLRVKGLWRE
jgi:hypothetical protein